MTSPAFHSDHRVVVHVSECHKTYGTPERWQQRADFWDSISPNPADEFSTRGPCQTCESWVLGGGIANVYLDPLDHFVKHELRVQGYFRYLVDYLLFGYNRYNLKRLCCW